MAMDPTSKQRGVLLGHRKRMATAQAAYERAAKKAADGGAGLSTKRLEQAKSRWLSAVNDSARYIASELGRVRWADGFLTSTEFGLGLIDFFCFQTTSDQNRILDGSGQMELIIESLLASRRTVTFK